MLTSARIEAVRAWCEEELCNGRTMKSPGKGGKATEVQYVKPRAFAGFQPRRRGREQEMFSVAPSITIMLAPSQAMRDREKRFDKYSGIHRANELGATMALQFLFTVYEPGDRNEDFAQTGSYDDIEEPGAMGYYLLLDWMDELRELLMGVGTIPKTDLAVNTGEVYYAPFMSENTVVDRRPVYNGFVTAEFNTYVGGAPNERVRDLLD